MRRWLEFAAVWAILKGLGLMPRSVARRVGAWLASLLFALRPRLRRIALYNLGLAFPQWTGDERRRAVDTMVKQLGWMCAEFAHFPRYTLERIGSIVRLEGEENYLAAESEGTGVLLLTGHLGAWELAPFAQGLYGHPLYFLVREMDNRRIDALVNRYRMLSGNTPIEKNESARAVLRVLRGGGSVGILADQNTQLEESVFVDFFGVPASTTSGIARVALRTGAAVVPGYIYWEASDSKYHLRFEHPVELLRTGDAERDVLENTARFTKVIENAIRQHPEQWIWMHKRWDRRPPGEPDLYPF